LESFCPPFPLFLQCGSHLFLVSIRKTSPPSGLPPPLRQGGKVLALPICLLFFLCREVEFFLAFEPPPIAQSITYLFYHVLSPSPSPRQRLSLPTPTLSLFKGLFSFFILGHEFHSSFRSLRPICSPSAEYFEFLLSNLVAIHQTSFETDYPQLTSFGESSAYFHLSNFTRRDYPLWGFSLLKSFSKSHRSIYNVFSCRRRLAFEHQVSAYKCRYVILQVSPNVF